MKGRENLNLLSNKLSENIEILDEYFKDAADYTKIPVDVDGLEAVFLSLEGQIDRQYMSISALIPLSSVKIHRKRGQELTEYISSSVLRVVDQDSADNLEDLITKLMLGFGVLLVETCSQAICFGGQGYKIRSVQNPDNENMLRGSKEGFVEALQINMSLIRRRMRSVNMKFERYYIGKESKTPIMICYLKNRVSDEILNKIKIDINKINLKTVMASGYLTGYFNKGGIFGTVGTTERPDTVCAKLEEGRVAIMVDGTPTVLIVPFLFNENFQSLDDYATKPFYATYIRYIKYICFFISAYLPALYVGVIVGRPGLLPDEILSVIAIADAQTPLSIFWEIIYANLLYEIMREAGLRAPKVFSQAVSIVGALVVGDMAVSAGLIGAPSLVIIALSAISGYAIPKLFEQLALIRFSLIIVSGIFGIWGIIFGFMFILYNICSEASFGVPITAPLSPFNLHLMRDVLERAPWRILNNQRAKVQNMPGTEIGKER